MSDDLTPLVETPDLPETPVADASEDFVPVLKITPLPLNDPDPTKAHTGPGSDGVGYPTVHGSPTDVGDAYTRLREERETAEQYRRLTQLDATPARDGEAGVAANGEQPVGRYEGPIYRQLRAKLESERHTIEQGLSRTHPNWAHAENVLEKVRAQEEENFRKALAGDAAPGESVGTKVKRNLSPLEAVGGALDAVDQLFQTARDISTDFGLDRAAMGAGIPALIIDENGPRLTTDPKELEASKNIGDYVPDIGDPNKPGFSRSLGQFFTGYAGASKALSGVQKLRTLAQSGWKGQSYASAIKGAVGDFFTADPMEANLANVVQEFPSIANPVAEALASKEDDPEVWNRLKTAATGAGFGLAADRFVAGVRYLWQKRKTGQIVADEAAKVVELESIAEAQRDRIRVLLGDPDEDYVFKHRTPQEEEEARKALGAGYEQIGEETGQRALPSGGMNLGDGIYVNTARIESDEDVKTIMQRLADRNANRIREMQRGVRSHGQTKFSAANEDAWSLLRQHEKGTAYNADETLALRQLWTASGEQVMKQAELVYGGGGPLDEVALNKMLEVHAMIQDVVLGVRTEQARALNQWNIPAGPSDQFLKGMQTLLMQNAGKNDAKLVADGLMRLKMLGIPGAPDSYIRGAVSRAELAKKIGVHVSDIMTQIFYMNILSDPRTQVVNIGGNFANQIWLAIERGTASGLGKFLDDQQIPRGEAGALIYGNIMGIRKAFSVTHAERYAAWAGDKVAAEAAAKRAAKAFDDASKLTDPEEKKAALKAAQLAAKKATNLMAQVGRSHRTNVGKAFYEGEAGHTLGKFEAPHRGALSAGAFGADPDSAMGQMLDLLDATTHIPQRGLQAGDEAFRSSNYFGQIYALAYRKAWRQVKDGLITEGEFADQVRYLAETPDQAMRLLADDYAAGAVFARMPPWNGKVYSFMRSMNRLGGIGKLLMAFTRVSYNVSNTGLRRSPAALAMPGFWRDVAAGGATEQLALAQMAVGTGALMVAADLADRALSPNSYFVGMQGGLGQGDVSKGERQNKIALGERANSLHIPLEGGRVASINMRRLEPGGGALVLAANVAAILDSDEFDDGDNDVSTLVGAAAFGMANQVLTQQFLTGLSQAVAVADNPLMNTESFMEYLGRTATPNALGALAYQQDPIIREVNGFAEAMMAKTPGLSDKLAASTDRWGYDLRRDSGLGGAYDLLSPLTVHIAEVHPIDVEADRLGVPIDVPSPKQSFDGVDLNLKKYPEAYRYFKQMQGHKMMLTVDGDPITAAKGTYENEGHGLRDELSAIVEGRHAYSKIYRDPDTTDTQRVDMVRSIINAYRDAAKFYVLKRYPELMAEGSLKWQDGLRTGKFNEQTKNRFFKDE